MAESEENEVLVTAQRGHLVAGEIIYVRGRKSVVVDVDFPNVYWRYYDDEVVKHRSYNVNPAMFQVPEGTPEIDLFAKNAMNSALEFTDSEGDDDQFNGGDHEDYPDYPSDDDDPEFEAHEGFDLGDVQDALNVDIIQGEGDQMDDQEPDSGVVPFPDPSNLQANLVSAFIGRKPKFLLSKISRETIEISETDVDRSQGIHIEHCSDLHVTVSHKVSNISINDCEKLVLVFPGVVSSLEMLRCCGSKVIVKERCSSIVVEESEDIHIAFSKDQETVKTVSRLTDRLIIGALNTSDLRELVESSPMISDLATTVVSALSNTQDQDVIIANIDQEKSQLSPEESKLQLLSKWVPEESKFSFQILQRDSGIAGMPIL